MSVADLTEIRVREPGRVTERWRDRRRRELVGPDGRLLVVAADHPARNALGVRDDPTAMASRADMLDRLVTAVTRPGVDGVLGVGRRVQGDDHDALRPGLLDRAQHTRRVVGCDHDAVDALGDEVLHRADLTLVVAVELTGESSDLDALLRRVLRRHVTHRDEERVGLRLRDEPDADVAAVAGPGVAPVAATRAISTQVPSKAMMAPPSKEGMNVPLVLAVTAGVLALGVVATLVVGAVAGLF